MNKNTFETTVKLIPDFIKNAAGYLKDNFDKNGQDLIENTNGTAALLIKLFAKPLIDNYFESKKEIKLKDFGFHCYLQAAIVQASKSLELIENEIENVYSHKHVFEVVKKTMEYELENIDSKEVILIFQPKYHPAVVYVKNQYERILNEFRLSYSDTNIFLKHFNENIEGTIASIFADDYEEHLAEIESILFKESESALLFDTIQNGKIGFKPNEDLLYQPALARWNSVSSFRDPEDEDENEEEINQKESELKNVESLVEEYFAGTPENHLDKILFIVADFGKGKSVFMRQYASDLAKNYTKSGEGYFPIYFNLRNFSNYSSETTLGVISDFLQNEYGIKIDDEYFRNKKYVFLVDSLDESGELNRKSIDKVINSIKKIQNIDKTKYRTNRIIVTSRPFDEGFINHLSDHKPYTIKNKENRDIPQYINIYGFTKNQFNQWLIETVKSNSDFKRLETTGFGKKILEAIENQEEIDIYNTLLNNKTLSQSELRRPIFAYMIYQLLIHNIDFLSIGKIGVYLSFLNLLTKEAKHINDATYKVNLREELEFRNVLHATTSLWMYERQRGRQGMLKKADICRVLEGKKISDFDNEVIEKYKERGFTEIQFLSHSYFGENDNILHFQHQSFAEILLAEYYLKIFIKFSLDEDADIDEARVRLSIGEPTEQSLSFFKEILTLLLETSQKSNNESVIEKRKLLFPMLASMSIRKNNRLFCNFTHFSWYSKFDLEENQTEYPKSALEKWCFDEKEIEKIIFFSSKILNSKTCFQTIQGNPHSALYDFEVFEIHNYTPSSTISMDKWLALIVGNTLYNNFKDQKNIKLFNTDYKINFNFLFDMLKNWNYASSYALPFWARELFKGLDMTDNEVILDLSHVNFDEVDFSYSTFKNIRSWGANWSRTKLEYCSFENVNFITSLFLNTSITNIKSLENFEMINCPVTTNGLVLLDAFKTTNFKEPTFRTIPQEVVARIPLYESKIEEYWPSLEGFIYYGLKEKFFTKAKLKLFFRFDSQESKKIFYKRIEEIKL
ncbi:MAG: hypothetical protein CUR32_11415 [Flavobacterium sp.]|nr:MAG: hypothetical protein CUR32_11415 [Flavobacterium sp.] [Flavobacterium sp. FEMGT703F]